MKTHSGGGRTPVSVGVKGGSPRADVISSGGADQLGQALGRERAAQPLVSGTAKAPVPMGNTLATNVGAGKPGAGRTVHPAGGQGKH
jgi:hypothetical protein